MNCKTLVTLGTQKKKNKQKKRFHWLVANTNRQSTSLKESSFPQTDSENLLLYSLKIIETNQIRNIGVRVLSPPKVKIVKCS